MIDCSTAIAMDICTIPRYRSTTPISYLVHENPQHFLVSRNSSWIETLNNARKSHVPTAELLRSENCRQHNAARTVVPTAQRAYLDIVLACALIQRDMPMRVLAAYMHCPFSERTFEGCSGEPWEKAASGDLLDPIEFVRMLPVLWHDSRGFSGVILGKPECESLN